MSDYPVIRVKRHDPNYVYTDADFLSDPMDVHSTFGEDVMLEYPSPNGEIQCELVFAKSLPASADGFRVQFQPKKTRR